MVLTVHFWAHSSPGGSGFPVALSAGSYQFHLEWAFFAFALGVPIFFALSGFLLWYPFAKSLAEGSAMQTPTQFYFRRIRRIMPALLFFTFFYLLLFYTLGPNRCAAPASPGDIATSLLFLAPARCLLQGNALPDLVPGTWSLTPEMWFYLLLPLLAVITRATSRKLLWLLIPAMLALGTLYQRHVVSDPRFVAHYNLRGCIHTFAWGMAAASLSVACPRIVNRKIFAYLGAALIVFATWYGGFVFGCLDTYFQVGLGAALVIVSVTGAESTIRAVCDAPLLRFIGKVSYSLFLCHVLVAWYFMPPLWSAFHVPPGPARFLVLVFLGVPAAIALATLGYEGIERPWLDKSMASSRFRRGRRTLLAAGGAFAVLCALIAVGEFHRPGCIAEMNGPAVQIVREMSWELSRSSADARGTGLRRTAKPSSGRSSTGSGRRAAPCNKSCSGRSIERGKPSSSSIAPARPIRYSRRTTGPSASPSPTDTRASGWRSKPWTSRKSLPPVITFPCPPNAPLAATARMCNSVFSTVAIAVRRR